MNLLDALLLALAVVAAIGGWRLGLITRSLSWLGMALGVILAARILPSIATSTRTAVGRGELVALSVGLFMGGAFAGQALGFVLGNRLNLAVHTPAARRLDSIGGAMAGVVGIVAVVWLLVPAVADVPGWPARAVRQSRVVHAVTDVLPAAPDATSTLRRLLGESYPQVFDALRPTPSVGTPPASSHISVAVSTRVTRSTVKVIGEACQRIQEGSGFVVAPGLAVTNAHVVAGEHTTILERSDGSRVTASVVAFDPERDVAVVRAPGLDRPALPLVDTAKAIAGSASGELEGAVYGHPGGGPLRIAPFRVSQQIVAVGSDIYDRSRTQRDVLVLASSLAPGDSGSALVTANGSVVGVAFAIAPDRPGVAYALAVDEVTPVIQAAGTHQVSTGTCVT